MLLGQKLVGGHLPTKCRRLGDRSRGYLHNNRLFVRCHHRKTHEIIQDNALVRGHGDSRHVFFGKGADDNVDVLVGVPYYLCTVVCVVS